MSHSTWTLQDIPDQSGRVVVITGANSGTGFETAKVLASRGATVVLACRNTLKAEEAARRIQITYRGSRVETQLLDLGSLASVREAAAAILARHDRLDLLINNAGVMVPPYGKTEDGFETQIGTNHFGPYVFTGLLMERLQATPGSRVVTMSSNAHRMGRIHFEDLHFERVYRAWSAYGQSKLANLLFTYELQRHAGWISWLKALGVEALLSQDALGGALPLLRAATDPAAQGGDYFGPSGFQEMKGAPIRVQSTPLSRDADLQQRLWRCSELSTGFAYAV